MRIKGIDYDSFSDQEFPNMELIRAWRGKKAWTAGGDKLLIIMVDEVDKFASIFEYDYAEDRDADVQMFRNLPDSDGEASTGITAPILPISPVRFGGYEEPLPVGEQEEESPSAIVLE